MNTPVALDSAGLHDALKGKMKKETEDLELNHDSSFETVNHLETNTVNKNVCIVNIRMHYGRTVQANRVKKYLSPHFQSRLIKFFTFKYVQNV